MTDIKVIEGIGPALAKKLAKAGIRSCEALLAQGANKKGREAIVRDSKVSAAKILKFVNHADLCRIKGVGGEYSELLEAAGVDSVPELAQRNAANLAAKMAEVNKKKKLVRAVPSEKRLTGWIAQAKKLPRVVRH
ncbi:MAG: DUF4332 domain-containing protein [Pseudomonadota bacterium]